MNIIQLVPRFDYYGGREEHVYHLSVALSRKGHNVKVFTGGTYAREAKDFTLRRFPALPLVISRHPVRVEYRFIPQLPFAITSEKTDILHAQDYRHFTTETATLAARVRKIPLVITIHGFYAQTRAIRMILKIYDGTVGKNILKMASKIITVSKWLEREYKSEFPEFDNKIIAIPNGINVSQYQNLPNPGVFIQQHGLDGYKVILASGRIIKRKGFQYLIRAIPFLKKDKEPNVKVVITGPDMGYKEELIKLAERLNVRDHVLFTGVLPERAFREAMAAAKAIAIPSIYEGLPLVLLEAMACGKPIVATTAGGIPEAVKNMVDAILVEPAEPTRIARAVAIVLRDSSLAKKLGQNAKKKAQNYDWENITKQTVKVYKECLQ